jgi:hypothetical protein
MTLKELRAAGEILGNKSKQWQQEIPQQGVLVKQIFNGIKLISCLASIASLVHDDDLTITRQYGVDAIGDDIGDISEITPLTAEEWWQFAPWEPIETAPRKEMIIAVTESGIMRMIVLTMSSDKYVKWLPLAKRQRS